ncbi:hypothetical protein GQ607_015670 [Colletotrichum asianum]|uniref:Uncharacterized protein n=1 Tax=Colletotrichum asianum TaxID=702518 RepID=A0A8H3VX73_9PEZI|nr:hypothetical protein GQ607_015670 [Colletotrichum asianum]
MPSKLIADVFFTDEYLPHSRVNVHNTPYAEIFHLETDVKMDDESTRHAASKRNPNRPAVFNALKGTEGGTPDTHLALHVTPTAQPLTEGCLHQIHPRKPETQELEEGSSIESAQHAEEQPNTSPTTIGGPKHRRICAACGEATTFKGTSTAREAGHTRATHIAGKLEGRSRFAMMAVLNELPGIRITFEVNHVKAQKYSDEDGPAEDKNNRRATNRCFKYIESKDDSRYRK